MVRTRSRFGCVEVALVLALASVACRPAAGTGAMLKIEAPEADRDADVYVDGNYVGQIDALDAACTKGVALAPGVHRVEIRKPGRFPVQKTVRVPARGPSPVVVSAELLEDPG
jgi:hypothetical protein